MYEYVQTYQFPDNLSVSLKKINGIVEQSKFTSSGFLCVI